MVVTVVFLNGGNHNIRVNKVGGMVLSPHRVYQLVIAWMRTNDDVQRGSDDPVAEVVGYNDLGDRNDFLTMLANSADIDSDAEYNHIAREVKAANTFETVPQGTFESEDLADPKESDALTQSDAAYIAFLETEFHCMRTGIDLR